GFKLLTEAVAKVDRRWDLSSLRTFLTAGEPVTLAVVREFLERLQPFGLAPRVIQPAYGMTECSIAYQDRFDLEPGARTFAKDSLAGTLVEVAADPPEARTFVHVGTPHAGVSVRIVDPEGRVVPEGVIGSVQARRTPVTPRYYPDL